MLIGCRVVVASRLAARPARVRDSRQRSLSTIACAPQLGQSP